MFALAFIMAIYFKLDKSQFIDVVLFVLITFFILVCMNLVLFNQFKKINIQSAQLTAYEQYLPVLDSLIQNVRIKQHNHANELQSIIGLMHTYKDYESLTREMNKYINISQTLSQPDFLLKLNMPLVAGFLYHKKLEASKTGVNLEYIINSYNLSSIVPEYELIELMGILIDNAVDAVKPDSIIHIGLDTVDGKIKFTTRNAGHIITQKERDLMFTKGYSTKHSGKHSGLGLYQLKNIVLNQYNGIIAVWNEGTDILFEITV